MVHTPLRRAQFEISEGSRFALAQRFLESLDRDVNANGAAVAEDVGDRLRHAEDRDGNALDFVDLDPVAEEFVGESDDAERRIFDLGFPVLGPDRDPDAARHLIGDAVEGKRRDEADHALGHALGRFGKAVIAFRGGVRELVKPPAEPGDHAFPFETGDGRCGDACAADFSQAGDPARAQEGGELVTLGAWLV